MTLYTTGDTGPDYQARIPLLDNDREPTGSYADLTGASVNFQMRKADDKKYQVNQPGTIVGAATDGRVKYSWQTNDLGIAGEYEVQFEVTFAGGEIQTTEKETVTVKRQ